MEAQKNIFNIKDCVFVLAIDYQVVVKGLEGKFGKSVSVLYGALPPETRRNEIDRFNSGATEILLATDCIGLGLNFFGIKRIVFASLKKWDGNEQWAWLPL